MARTKLARQYFEQLNLLAQYVAGSSAHRGRFHNFSADFENMFPAEVGHTDQRNDYRSALSPTAYFVDLVRLVSAHIKPPADDRLAMPNRRPDIFELELSRDKAEKMVPYLEIVNTVMRTYLEQTLKKSLKDSPSALEALSTSHFPFSLPFHLPLTQTRTYLQHFQIDLADIYAAFRLSTDDPAWISETLNLAPGELEYLARADATVDALSEAYGVTITDTSLGGLDTAATFMAQTDLTQAQLENLAQVQQAHGPGVALSLQSAEAADGETPVQTIGNLALPVLGYLNRFIRLVNRLGWSFDDLSWALTSIRANLIKAEAENQKDLAQLARIQQLHHKYKLPIDVLCSFESDMRTTPPLDQPDSDSLFDRVFNTPPFYHNGKPGYEKYNPQNAVIDWNSAGQSGDDQKIRASLQGALNVSATDLAAIVNHLFNRLFAATDNGLYFSDNDGTSWQQTGTGKGEFGAIGVSQVVISDSRLFVATNNGLYFSDDSGKSWQQTGTGTEEFGAVKVNQVEASGSRLFAATNNGLYFSDNDGTSWQQTGIGNEEFGATNVSQIIFSGNRLFAGTGDGLFVSDDNGASWLRTGHNEGEFCGNAVVRVFASSNRLLANTVGGLFISDDNGVSWRPSEENTIGNKRVNQFARVKFHTSTLDLATLTRFYRFSRMAQVLDMPIPAYLAFLSIISNQAVHPKPSLPTAEINSLADLMIVADWADWLAEIGLNVFQLQYLTGGNLSPEAARIVGQGLTPASAVTAVNNYLQQMEQWTVKPAAFAHDGVDDKLAETIAANLVAGGLLDNDGLVIRPAAALTENAVKSALGPRLFALTANDDLYVSENSGTTWSPVNGLGAVAVDQVVSGGNRLFALLKSGGLYVSDENAITWTQVSGLDGAHINQVAAIDNYLFAGTDKGLFVSDDKGIAWTRSGKSKDGQDAIGDYPVFQVVAVDNRLVAGTLVGLYISDDKGRTWTFSGKSKDGQDAIGIQNVFQVVVIDHRLFAGTFVGLFVSDDQGTSWILSGQDKAGQDAIGSWQVNRVFASDNRIFAGTFVGLFVSDDRGTSWTLSGQDQAGQGAIGSSEVTQVVAIGSYLFARTSTGLFVSDDKGITWTRPGQDKDGGLYISENNGKTEKYSITQVVTADNPRFASVLKILQNALDQQTKGATAFWAEVLGTDTGLVSAALRYVAGGTHQAAGAPLAPALVTACRTELDIAQTDGLQTITRTVVDRLTLLLYLAKAVGLSIPQFQAILDYATGFGISAPGAMTGFNLGALRQIADFKQLANAFAQQADTVQLAKSLNAPTHDPHANSTRGLVRYLQAAGNKQSLTQFALNGNEASELSQLSGRDARQITTLTGHLATMVSNSNFGAAAKLPQAADAEPAFAQTISYLVIMHRCFELAGRLGVDIQLLTDLCNLHTMAEPHPPESAGEAAQAHARWQQYVSTAQAFLGVVRSKYSPDDWHKTFDPIRDHLNEQERDALAAFLLRQLQSPDMFPDIKTMQDLYEFLLIDVEMSGCAQTTYIKEAIDCLQIYSQRCRMNLESDVTLSEAIPDVLWDWMGHFRVWQANRKLFLYPENYLDPTLRTQEATPEFKALQNELLQGDINKETVEQAYISYFDKLDELANLEIIDGCYAQVTNPNSSHVEETLFLIGKTTTEPPTYYWRQATLKAENGVLTGDISGWRPWQKVDQNIPVDRVLPLYTADRFYLFWVEQKAITKRDTANDPASHQTLAAIKYTYRQVSGKWVQPQALAKDVDVTTLPQSFWIAPGEPNARGTYLWLLQQGDVAISPPLTVLGQINGGPLASVSNLLTNPGSRAISARGVIGLPVHGSTWTPVSDLNAQVVGQLLATGNRLFAATKEGLYISDDNGTTWKPVSELNAQVVIDIVVIGNRLFAYGDDPGLHISDDNGTTWKPVSELNAQVVIDIVVIGNRLFAGTGKLPDTRIYVSDDNGATWKLVTEPWTHQLTRVVGINNRLFAATKEGLYISDDNGTTWKPVSDLNAQVVIDIVVIGNRLFAYGDDPGLHISDDNGTTWKPVSELNAQVVDQLLATGNRLFAGTGKLPDTRIYVSDDNGTTWKLVTEPWTHQLIELDTLNNRLFAATKEGFFINDDNGTRWTRVGDLKAQRGVILIGNRLFAYGDDPGLHISDDNGTTWKPVSELNAQVVIDIVVIGNRLFAATKEGLYQQVFPVISLMVAGGDTWLALPNQTAEGAPTYRVHRVTTSCVHKLRQTLVQGGLDELLTPQSQTLTERPFADLKPSALVRQPYPSDTMDFDLSGAYSLYFREIFFHIPYLIGHTLQAHQQFKEARRWYEYIFNPLAPPEQMGLNLKNPMEATVAQEVDENKSRFWQYKPFRDLKTLEILQDAIQQSDEVKIYEDDPFDPHAVAQFRLGAYEKAVVMAYIDNLLAWGDALYALDGWENINAATTLYVLAAELLGPRPQPGRGYIQVNGGLPARDAHLNLHQPRTDLAHLLLKSFERDSDWASKPFFDVPQFFFLPENDQFAGYWNTVEKRLYQIRHCMNLQGIVRQLPLFQPPIDPRQLMRAVAAGRSIDSVTTGTAAHVPHYRFSYLLERARQVTGELKQLGGALLSALEKQDAEHLAMLRNTYEGAILNLTTLIKQKQQEETQHNLEGLQQSLASATMRHAQYQGWATQRLSPGEKSGLSLTQEASNLKTTASLITQASAIAYLFPNIYGLADGGANYGKAVEVGAGVLNFEASILEWAGQLAMSRAHYDRRQADWQIQADLASYDVQQIEAQIHALKVRQAMTDQELAIHQQSITQNQEIDEYYKQKFTSQELYQWMVGRLGTVYFQTYQLALDLARMTELAFQYERNTLDSYVNVNGWDGLKKGLLVGEALALNLNQLEKAYIEQNSRELEIEKTISLRQLYPQALLAFKAGGKCSFAFPEVLFDLDFPGHYLRKIKTISLSIPAVVGPYQTVQATLIQLGNQVVLTPAANTVNFLLGEAGNQEPDNSTLRSNWRVNQQIALSRGVNDSGMFELNFRDERYLPFEGTGVVSTWELRMPKASNPINFDSISDVIITLRYTAQDGGDAFRQEVLTSSALQNLSGYRLFNVRQLNATGWQAFKNGTKDSLELSISPEHFPRNLSDLKMDDQDGKEKPIALYTWPAQNGNNLMDSPTLTLPDGTETAGQQARVGTGWEFVPSQAGKLIGTWKLQLAPGSEAKTILKDIDELFYIVPFQGTLNWGWLQGNPNA